MKMHRFLGVALVLALFIFAQDLHAGQVITDAERSWAKAALEQEGALEAAPAPNTVAVLAFRSAGPDPGLAPLQKGFAFLLMTDLAQVQGITVVERVRIQALLEELGLGASGLVDETTAPRVGRLLGAGYLVGGELSGGSGRLSVISDVLAVRDRNSLGRPSADGLLEQVFDVEKKILFGVIDILKISLSKKDRERLARPATRDFRAFVSLCRGLDASDRGNFEAAARFYSKALEIDPSFAPARAAMDELKALKAVPPKPSSQAALDAQAEQNSSTLTLGRTVTTVREFRPAETTGQIRVTW